MFLIFFASIDTKLPSRSELRPQIIDYIRITILNAVTNLEIIDAILGISIRTTRS